MLGKWNNNGRSGQTVSLLIAIASIALTIILHLQSKNVAELSYEHSRVTVFDSTQYSIPMLHVMDIAENPIEGSVFIEQYLLRNSGNVTLNRENFPIPLRMNLIGPGRVLDATIEDATNSEITWPVIRIKKPGRLVEIKWIMLPENEQILVKITFSGESSTRIDIDGYVISGNIVEFSASTSDARSLFAFICTALYIAFVYLYWRKVHSI